MFGFCGLCIIYCCIKGYFYLHHKMDEYKGHGSVYAIFEWYAKQELNASGDKPVFVKPEVSEKKKKA